MRTQQMLRIKKNMITLQEKFIIVTEVFERGFTYNQTDLKFLFESLT